MPRIIENILTEQDLKHLKHKEVSTKFFLHKIMKFSTYAPGILRIRLLLIPL